MLYHLCALFYGDHADLACRLLDSWFDWFPPRWSTVADIRIGLNAVSNASRDNIMQQLRRSPVPVHIFESPHGHNVYKYPLMRCMLRGLLCPVIAPVIQWFDDDSYVKSSEFWSDVDAIALRELATALDVDPPPVVVGSVYKPGYHYDRDEMAQIQQQPWFTGKSLETKPSFCTGGWWMASHRFLRAWDYPWSELRHNGGDVLLGELIRQQSGRLIRYNKGVAINADAGGKESAAKRRGVTTRRPWQSGQQVVFDPFFLCRVTTLTCGSSDAC